MNKDAFLPSSSGRKRPTFLEDRRLYRIFSRNPLLWRNIQLIRYRNSRLIGQIVSPSHHLVLEGFPRSGNSFSVRAFLQANGMRRTWSIAHHFHKLPQILLGVRWQRPTIVLIRNPDEAVLSLFAHSIIKAVASVEDTQTQLRKFQNLFEHWQHYYEIVYELRDDVVLSDFSTTTQRFDLVLQAANTKFEKDFAWDGLSCSNTQKAIFETGGSHLSPSRDRDSLKDQLREIIRHAELEKAREVAQMTYEKLRRHTVVCKEFE